jgi:hypothetical protein
MENTVIKHEDFIKIKNACFINRFVGKVRKILDSIITAIHRYIGEMSC